MKSHTNLSGISSPNHVAGLEATVDPHCDSGCDPEKTADGGEWGVDT